MVTFQGTVRFATYIAHSRFHTYMITLHNYAGSKRPLYAIMKMLLIASLAKARHVIRNINDSNLVAVRHTIYRLIHRSNIYTVVVTLNIYNLQRNLLYESGLQI
jgi:hypothetical protein